jgi:hypothetical protein
MTIRLNSALISSVLFTIALGALVPHNIEYASTWRRRFFQEGRNFVQNQVMPLGFASLAVVAVGLIVIWAAYIKRVRWTWFVMFVIVWVFYFPAYVLPEILAIQAAESVNWLGWLHNAMSQPGIDRAMLKVWLDFLLMLVALFLPARSFLGRKAGRDAQ